MSSDNNIRKIQDIFGNYYIDCTAQTEKDGEIQEEYRLTCEDGTPFFFLLSHSDSAESMASDFIKYAREEYRCDEEDMRERRIKQRLNAVATEIEEAMGWRPRVEGAFPDRHPQNY